MMKAADIMVRDVVAVAPEASVREIAALMVERRISGTPVVDGGRRVLGIVSEGDLIRRPEIGTYQSPSGWLSLFISGDESARDFVKTHGLTAREVMSQPAVCAAPQALLADVVVLMERHRIKRLPIVEDGKLVGLVTRADLVRALVARPANPPPAPADREIRDLIEAILRSEAWAASAVVYVQVENGVAHLWGTVESASQREALIVAARGVPGVKELRPHLGRAMAG